MTKKHKAFTSNNHDGFDIIYSCSKYSDNRRGVARAALKTSELFELLIMLGRIFFNQLLKIGG